MANKRHNFIAARKAAGLSQEKLAEALSVERSTVQRWENDGSTPLPFLWPKIAKKLNVTTEQLRYFLENQVETYPKKSVEDAPPEGRLVQMADMRARQFLGIAEVTTVGPGGIEQFTDDVRRLAEQSHSRPFAALLPELVALQDHGFRLLEGRMKPNQARDLYFLTGLTTAFIAKAAHDLGRPREALTQARTAYVCADNAGHTEFMLWVSGLESLITYWSGRWNDALRYTQRAESMAADSRYSSRAWIASSAARALGALGRTEEAAELLSLARALIEDAVEGELDQFGGFCAFTSPTRAYYESDALAWGGVSTADLTERAALAALDELQRAPQAHRGGFGNVQGVRCNLAIARLHKGDIDGAQEAIAPVLAISTSERQAGIVLSAERVRRVLIERSAFDGKQARAMDEALEGFTSRRLELPQ